MSMPKMVKIRPAVFEFTLLEGQKNKKIKKKNKKIYRVKHIPFPFGEGKKQKTSVAGRPCGPSPNLARRPCKSS